MEILKQTSLSEVKEDRRQFLKFFAVSGVALLAGKVLGNRFDSSQSSSSKKGINLKDFNVVETANELKLYSKSGEEVLTIDSTKSNNS